MRVAFPHSTIYAFEPSATAFPKLQARTAGDSRVRVFQQAVVAPSDGIVPTEAT